MDLQQLHEQSILTAPMCEMANLYPQKTGVPVVMWMGEVGGQHGPRVKVSNTPGRFNVSDCFVVAVAKDPYVITPRNMRLKSNVLDDVLDWVKINYDILMQMWKLHESGDGDLDDLLSKLTKL